MVSSTTWGSNWNADHLGSALEKGAVRDTVCIFVGSKITNGIEWVI